MRLKVSDLLKTKVGQLPQNKALFALDTPPDPKRERQPLSALVKDKARITRHQTSVAYIITIVSYRHKQLDDDNIITGAKPLRDAIATSLGVDDADPRIRWEVRQVITNGQPGTDVIISSVPNGAPISKGTVAAARAY